MTRHTIQVGEVYPKTSRGSGGDVGASCYAEENQLQELAPETLESLVDTAQAANLAGVTTDTIRQWSARGHLPKAGLDNSGRPLYKWIDVAKAERATRDRARRKYQVIPDA